MSKRLCGWCALFSGALACIALIIWANAPGPSGAEHKQDIHSPAAEEGREPENESIQPSSPAPTAELIGALRTDRPDGYPPFEVVRQFSTNDEDRVVAAFRETAWTNRASAIWVLARIGGTRSSEVLQGAINGGTVPASVSLEEERVMHVAAFALGFISARDDSAYNYLTNHILPSSWESRRGSLASERLQAGFGLRRLAGAMVKGAAMSGRREIPAMLEHLRADPELRKADFSGALSDAAFFHDYVTSYGHDALLRAFLNYQIGDQVREWRQTTENGKAWWAWFLAVHGRGAATNTGTAP